jgi:putative ABC transport system permease protein
LNGEGHSVIGIAPPEFQFPRGTEIWTPARLVESTTPRGNNYLNVIGRLEDGVEQTQAQAQMNQVAAVLAQQYPVQNAKLTVSLSPLLTDEVRDIRSVLWILLGAVALVLLIACANVANLLLARAVVRKKEFDIRMMLGAGRWRVIRQLLVESTVLALSGGLLGVLLAMWSIHLLVALAPGNIPRVNEISLDKYVLGFTLLTSLLTGIIFGLAPAWQSARSGLNAALREGPRGVETGSLSQSLMRRTLVVAEIALSFILLVSAGLLISSLHRLLAVDPGFNSAHLLTADISFPHRPASAYEQGDAGEPQRKQEVINFLNEAQRRVAALPGVEAVGMVSDLPLTGNSGMNGNFKVEGLPEVNWADAPNAPWHLITPDYFRAIGIPLLKGRAFTERDTTQGPFSIMINETLAHQFFSNDEPIGKHLRLLDGRPHEIIGVIGAVRQAGLNLPPDPQIYFSYFQMGFGEEATLVIRTMGDPVSLSETVRWTMREVNSEAPIFRLEPMTEVLSHATTLQRFNTVLMISFAVVALVMAAIGLYSVLAYAVTQRTHEVGIRMALGAQQSDVLKMIMGQGLALALIGLAIGMLTAFCLTRLMSGLLYGVSPTDPATFIVIALLLTSVALLACYFPARRAMKVDPMIALRFE